MPAERMTFAHFAISVLICGGEMFGLVLFSALARAAGGARTSRPRAEFVGPVSDRLVAELGKAFPHRRLRENSNDLSVQKRNDLLVRAGWSEHPDPGIAFHARISGFRHGRDVGHRPRPSGAGYCQR